MESSLQYLALRQTGWLPLSHSYFSIIGQWYSFCHSVRCLRSKESIMLEPALRIMILSNEENCSLQDCWLRYIDLNWSQELRSSMGGILTLSVPRIWLSPHVCQILCQGHAINKTRKLLLTYLSKSPVSLIGVMGETCFRVMLTFHGRLMTPHLFWTHVCLSKHS